MNPIAVILLVCGLIAVTHAKPGYHGGGGGGPLVGVPDLSSYDKLTYPQYDVLDLGTSIKGSLPPAVVQITQVNTVKVPQPYPVKVPHPVPVPVPVAKPYPVVQTKIIKVPHPVPVEIVKKVAVPYEIPKPYPVPSEEFKAPHAGAQVASYGGSFAGYGGGLQHLDHGNDVGGGDGGYESFEGSDQLRTQQGYEAVADQAQQAGWQGIPGGYDGGAEAEEQH